MAKHPDDSQPDDEEAEGGATTTDLEHLEDLRWVLIKSAVATLVGMTVCLFNCKAGGGRSGSCCCARPLPLGTECR
jgi:hypothetical protein